MKPILFNTDMVQGILVGRKTQTRRVVNPQPIKVIYESNGEVVLIDDGRKAAPPRPYCEGDILYVRETWTDFFKDDKIGVGYVYRADDECVSDTFRWNSSSSMPREAARLFLKVTKVRVERLQDITLEDIEREGLYCEGDYEKERNHYAYPMGMRIHFLRLWDDIYEKRGYGWDVNPYVWVIEFERTDGGKQ